MVNYSPTQIYKRLAINLKTTARFFGKRPAGYRHSSTFQEICEEHGLLHRHIQYHSYAGKRGRGLFGNYENLFEWIVPFSSYWKIGRTRQELFLQHPWPDCLNIQCHLQKKFTIHVKNDKELIEQLNYLTHL